MSLAVAISYGSITMADSSHSHNLSNNPIGSALGFSNLEYSYRLNNNLTVGLLGSNGKIDVGNIELKGGSYGVISRYYLNPAFKTSSWYLLASAVQTDYEGSVVSGGVRYDGKQNGTVLALGSGYHWFWSSFNINLGAFLTSGEKFTLADQSGNPYTEEINTTIGAEFNIGWKF